MRSSGADFGLDAGRRTQEDERAIEREREKEREIALKCTGRYVSPHRHFWAMHKST